MNGHAGEESEEPAVEEEPEAHEHVEHAEENGGCEDPEAAAEDMNGEAESQEEGNDQIEEEAQEE